VGIDRWGDPRPLPVQLAAILRAQILAGEFDVVPDQKLPSETTLMQEYGVSRNSVRGAIALLRDEGIVQTRPQYGSRVAPREDWPQG
jgi:DNA-binding GntR family transcriptional regulator